MAIYTLINGFNMYKSDLKYDELVFSLKFFIYEFNKVSYFIPDIKKMKLYPQRFAMLAAYMLQIGTSQGDVFFMPQSSLDFVLESLKDIGNVCYLEPGNLIALSSEICAPAIKILPNSETDAFVEVEEGFEIIQGRFTGYVLFGDTLYTLPKDFPISFYRFINGKSTVLDFKHIPDELRAGYVPGIVRIFQDKGSIEKENISDVNVRPVSRIYAGKCSEEGCIYVKPVMSYGSYIDVVAGGEYIQGDHYMVTMEGRKYRVKRDEIGEILLRNEFKRYSYFFDFSGDRYICCREDSVRVLMEDLLPGLGRTYEIIYNDGLEKLVVKKNKIRICSNVHFNSDNGLFDFDVDFHCENHKLGRKDLLELLEKGRRYLIYGFDYIEVENVGEVGKILSLLNNNGSGPIYDDSGRLRFSLTPAKTVGVESIFTGCGNVEYNADLFYKRFVCDSKEKRLLEDAFIDINLRDILRTYQINGVNWITFLVKYGLGGILADDMGLGKTLQVLAAIGSSSGEGISIVVCPKTLIYSWYEEIKKFTPGIKVLISEGNALQRKSQLENAGRYDLIITSYPLIRNDLENYLGFRFKYCILDEAQNIKNPDAESTKSVKLLKAGTRLALSGTPMENSLLELWSIFDFLMPGFLGSRKEFIDEFGYSPERLREKIKPFILRRTKKDTLKELPPKIEQVRQTAMEQEQLALYLSVLEAVRKDLFEEVERKGFDKSRIQILAALTRLRQICNHPGLVNEKYLKDKNVSAKLELFEELINDSIESGHKVLVFSQFAKMLGILAETLKESNIRFSYLDGGSQNRGNIIKEFNEDEDIKVFLISLKAGGCGLNLTSADTVILFDPWWNPMVEDQAIDRAYRMGQDRTVNVYRLITKGTIEEKIQALQQKKKALFDAVINENEGFIEKMSWEDIREVLL